MQNRLQRHQAGATHGQKLAEAVRSPARDTEADKHDRDVHADQHQDTQEAPFLSDHGEDEVVMRFGQEAELLAPLTDPHAGQAAGAESEEGLMHLEAGAGRIRRRIQERLDARSAKSHRELTPQNRRGQKGEEREMRDSCAGSEDDERPEHGDHHRSRQVGLQGGEDDDQPPHREEGAQPAPQRAEMRSLPHGEGRGPHHDGNLCDLGRLNGDARHEQPATRAIGLGRDRPSPWQEHQHESQNAGGQQRPCEVLPQPVGKPGAHHEAQQADARPGRLVQDVIRVRDVLPERQHRGGRVQGDEPEREQQQGEPHHGGGLPAAPQAGVRQANRAGGRDVHRASHDSSSASAAKRRPRCSYESNMS